MKIFLNIRFLLFTFVPACFILFNGCSSDYFSISERKEESGETGKIISDAPKSPNTVADEETASAFSAKIGLMPQLSQTPDGKPVHQIVFCYYGMEDIFPENEYLLNISIDGKINTLTSPIVKRERERRLETSTISYRLKNHVISAGYQAPDAIIKKLAEAKRVIVIPGKNSKNQFALSNMDILAFRKYSNENIKENKYEGTTEEPVIINPDLLNDSAPITIDVLSKLGFSLSELSESGKQLFAVEKGVYISRINNESEADKQGFKKGTIITNIGARDISGIEDMISFMNSKRGQIVNLTLKNLNGEFLFLKLKLP